MPDALSLTSGVSLGLLAGIVSGVCYLVANRVTWPKDEQTSRRRCLRTAKDDGVCVRCGGDQLGGYIPCICQDYNFKPVKFESGAWFLRQAHRAANLMPWSLSTDKLEQIDEEYDGRDSPGPSARAAQNDATVREFLETLAAKLTGGTLEGTRVSSLYDHPAYLPPLRNGSQSSASSRPSSGASNAHVHLKRLVARVVEEAAALPALARYASDPHTPTVESSTYEDLLASAILNKVIERFQNENGSGGRSSGIHSASASPTPSERSSPRSLASRNITHHSRDITPPLHEDEVSDWEEGEATDDALEVPRRVPFPEFGGDIVHNIDDNEEREFDEVSNNDLQGVDGTWEENWLFQKKKIKTIQSVPVPMLVPNSNADYRAMIGDRDADDTTDLSDNASDAEEQGGEYKSDIKKVLDSKHVIGGKIKVDDESDYEPDSLTMDETSDFDKLVENGYKNDVAVNANLNEINENVTIAQTKDATEDVVDGIAYGSDSVLMLGVDDGPLPKAEFNLKEEIHRSLMNGNAHYANDQYEEVFDDSIESIAHNKESNNNTLNHHEREGEYEETVTVPVQRYADSLRRKHFEDTHYELHTEIDDSNDDELVPGSVAYKERKKWLNCVEMPNNPYSPEAIQKRLLAKSTSSLFDMITSKQEFEENNETSHDTDSFISENDKANEIQEKEQINLSSSENRDIIGTNRGSKSPPPNIPKEVLADEVPQYKRYGRDYYIREAKPTTGSRKKNSFSDTSSLSSMNKSTSLDNFDTEFASPGLLIKQFHVIATNQQYNQFAGKDQKESITTMPNNKTNILIEYEDFNDLNVYSARPAIVNDETDEKFEEILQSAYKSEIAVSDTEQDKNDEPIKSPISVANSYLSSSSLEDSIKIYNIQTGEVIKCRPDDNISARYETTAESRENIDIRDKGIPGDTFDSISQNGVSDEEAVVIKESNEDNLEICELEDILPQLPKVKELAKKFVSMDNLSEPVIVPQPYSKRRRSKENVLNDLNANKPANKQMYMHSLTARSITKEFREGLKLSMSTPIKVPGGSKDIPDGEVTKESSRPGSPMPEPGTLKTKLAFFESLKNKFSSK